MKTIHVYTIGFTQKTARYFFETLKKTGVKRIIDVRLNNASQLAGFTKRDDIEYFLQEIGHIEYVHYPELAPTKTILDAYKKQKGDWGIYEQQFVQLLKERHVEQIISREVLDQGCLLCSEATPDHCHRRLIAEYLQDKLGDIYIEHLV